MNWYLKLLILTINFQGEESKQQTMIRKNNVHYLNLLSVVCISNNHQ